MSHVFVIVGYPLRESYWKNGNKFAFEQEVLGRNVDADDLEILEVVYNLKFLHDNRDYIYTFKQAPYELAYGSPMATRPDEFGLKADWEKFGKTHLSSSIPFDYASTGPSLPVLNNLIDLYSLWKRKEMPFQPVVQEFQYSQRIIQELGAEKIAQIAHQLPESKKINPEDELRELEILMGLWNKLTNNGKVDNGIRKMFPGGFKSYGDLYSLADQLEAMRNKS